MCKNYLSVSDGPYRTHWLLLVPVLLFILLILLIIAIIFTCSYFKRRVKPLYLLHFTTCFIHCEFVEKVGYFWDI